MFFNSVFLVLYGNLCTNLHLILDCLYLYLYRYLYLYLHLRLYVYAFARSHQEEQATSRHDERRLQRCMSRSSIYAKLSSLCTYLASEQLAQSCQVICMLTRRQRRTVHKSQVTIAIIYIFISKAILYISLLISLCKAQTNLRAGPEPTQPQRSGAGAVSRMKIPLFSTVSTRKILPSVQPRPPIIPSGALTITGACILRRILTVAPRLITFCRRDFTYWPWFTSHSNTPLMDVARCDVAPHATVGHRDPVPSM